MENQELAYQLWAAEGSSGQTHKKQMAALHTVRRGWSQWGVWVAGLIGVAATRSGSTSLNHSECLEVASPSPSVQTSAPTVLV